MKFTICDEDKVFPFLIVDDLYSKNEQELIWEELRFHKDNFTLDYKTGTEGVAKDKNGKPIANLTRIYLDDIYGDNRQDSDILNVYTKIVSQDVREAYRNTTPSWRTFEITNKDCSLVSYYENQQDYKEHFDKFMHTALVWFYKEPKRFTGGDLTFTQSKKTVECKHNRMVLFPSYYLHAVDEVSMEYKYRGKGLGRYCLTHFYNKG